MIENRISGYLYNELFSESNEEKCTAFQSMAWSLIVHNNTIKNCSTALQAFSFRSLFVSFISFFIKARILLQFLSQAFSILYFLIFFCFHKCYDNFHLRKNILINKFFHWSMCFFIVLPPWRKGVISQCWWTSWNARKVLSCSLVAP